MILFPDAEALLVRVLPDLVGVPVSTRVPSPRPSTFVTVRREGGTRRDLVTDEPVVRVECWAETEPDAALLARRAQAYLYALAQTEDAGDYVRAVSESAGLTVAPDPTSGSPRYVFSARLQTRGEVIT